MESCMLALCIQALWEGEVDSFIKCHTYVHKIMGFLIHICSTCILVYILVYMYIHNIDLCYMVMLFCVWVRAYI